MATTTRRSDVILFAILAALLSIFFGVVGTASILSKTEDSDIPMIQTVFLCAIWFALMAILLK